MLAALISAIAAASSVIIDKVILSRRRVHLKTFLPIAFGMLFVLTMLLVPFYGSIDWQIAVLPNSLFLLFLMVVIAIAWNVLFYQSLQKEKVHHHELLMMTAPFVTIMLAAVFYPEELNPQVFVLAIVASVALLMAKGGKEHLLIDKTSYNMLLAVVLMSTESILIRELLYYYTPVALYAIRTFFIAIFFIGYYRPNYAKVSLTNWWWILGSSMVGVVLMLTRFYAFSELGIIYTTLVAILGPIIVFYASWEILHEKIRPRMIAASLVVLACVTWATIIAFG